MVKTGLTNTNLKQMTSLDLLANYKRIQYQLITLGKHLSYMDIVAKQNASKAIEKEILIRMGK